MLNWAGGFGVQKGGGFNENTQKAEKPLRSGFIIGAIVVILGVSLLYKCRANNAPIELLNNMKYSHFTRINSFGADHY